MGDDDSPASPSRRTPRGILLSAIGLSTTGLVILSLGIQIAIGDGGIAGSESTSMQTGAVIPVLLFFVLPGLALVLAGLWLLRRRWAG